MHVCAGRHAQVAQHLRGVIVLRGVWPLVLTWIVLIFWAQKHNFIKWLGWLHCVDFLSLVPFACLSAFRMGCYNVIVLVCCAPFACNACSLLLKSSSTPMLPQILAFPTSVSAQFWIVQLNLALPACCYLCLRWRGANLCLRRSVLNVRGTIARDLPTNKFGGSAIPSRNNSGQMMLR